ncbi:hypothetical protein [uncultured Helicobacter sp.]|uniref:hypothetical protein n=1 Tax=uncultured Helicobacter sp. TaxID=175537 RepID=UPI00374E6545
MVFGKPDENLMRGALMGCDIAHFFLPFRLEIVGVKICRELEIPYTGAFLCNPNTSVMRCVWILIDLTTICIGDFFAGFIAIYITFNIHCPSRLMQKELERMGLST